MPSEVNALLQIHEHLRGNVRADLREHLGRGALSEALLDQLVLEGASAGVALRRGAATCASFLGHNMQGRAGVWQRHLRQRR